MSTEYTLTDEIPHWPGINKDHPEGLTGAIFGDIAVSTPNSLLLYLPLFGQVRSLYIRSDFKFGIDDPMICPQIYMQSTSHIACGPAPTFEHDYQHLFQPWQDEWWEPLEGYPDGNVGKIKPDVMIQFKVQSRTFDQNYVKLQEDLKRSAYRGVSFAEFDTQKMKDDIYWRKTRWIHCSKAGTLTDIKFRFVNAQRHEWNLRSRIAERLTFHERLQSMGSVQHLCDNTRMGAMTTNFNTARMLYKAGLPVWYLYDAKVANPAKFKRFMSPSEVLGMQQCIEIPPRPYQMGSYGPTLHPDLAFITGGKQPFFSRKILENSKELWKGPGGHPKRYDVMTLVISRLRTFLEQVQGDSSSATAPATASRPFLSSPKRNETLEYELATSSVPPLVQAASSSSREPPPAQTTPLSPRASTASLKRAADESPSRSSGPPPANKKKKSGGKKKKPANADADVKKPIQRDRSRFEDVENDSMPPAIPSCQLSLSRVGTALAMTGKEVPTFPGVSRRFLGYPFPEAAMLGNLSKRETQTTYLVNFIRLLPILEYCVDCIEDAKDDMVLLYSNMWRNVLAGTEPDHKHGTIANAKRTAYLICFTELLENSGLPSSTVDLHHLHSIPANWCGVPLAEANTANADLDIIHTEVAREIIWFINEVNWRAEMLALDRFLYDAEQLHLDNDPQTPQERRVIVIQHMQHWGQTVVPPEDVIGQDVGFASLDLGERLTAAFNLIEVMSTWTLGGAWCVMPDKLKELDKEMRYRFIRDGEVPPVRLIDQFEEEMWAHYIHSFVHVFARAPSLPRAIRPGSLSA